MKFRLHKDLWEVNINNSWFTLCVCSNCKNVAGLHTAESYSREADIICCCNSPYYKWAWGYDDDRQLVENFVKKWSDG